MSTAYQEFGNQDELPRLVAALSARTIVVDVEPLVAPWNSSQEALDGGIMRVLDQAGGIQGLRAVCFATNSARRPSALPRVEGIDVSYLVSAGKPVRTARYARLPRPGVVVGDQVLTDGLLARRLDFSFLHYRPALRAPIGPRLLDSIGRLMRRHDLARHGKDRSTPGRWECGRVQRRGRRARCQSCCQ
jgi:predicted HAD superfamily phosphohydrolase YqeG